MDMKIRQQEVEIRHLELRFAHTRIRRPAALAAMITSLERYGQTTAVVITGEAPMVLMDGYLRVAALSRLGKDMVLAERWPCDEAESLIRILLRKQDRRWESLEEAWLIRELQERHRYTQEKVAALLGRHQSWVSRRLLLLESLPEEILAAVRDGALSTWSAVRVLAPMARAIPEHARRLAATLGKEHLSTRELALLWQHYQKATRKQREKIIEAPAVFIKALRIREEEQQQRALEQGPDGKWLHELKVAGHILIRLRRNAAEVLHPEVSTLERRAVRTGFAELEQAFIALRETISLRCSDDSQRDRGGDSDPAEKGGADQADLPVAENLAQCGSPGSPRPAGEALTQ